MTKSLKCVVLALVLLGILISFGMCYYQYIYYCHPHSDSIDNYSIIKTDKYDLSIAKENDETLYLFGWVAVESAPPVQFCTKLVLYKEGQSEIIWFPLKLRADDSITTAFNNGNNYNEAGFESRILIRYLQDNEYLVGFLLDINRETMLVKTDQLLSKYYM